ncbi:MAG: MFS transporter [Paracoccaceae bacterium]|nr:MFS transporter [Paracoccaceae bacterium]MDE2914762.1 MFS transporter [Paracoccaceae bacterium]
MLAISFSSLFLTVLLVQLSSGGLGPLDALSGSKLGFATSEIGVLGSAHFLGFFLGCWWAPRLIGLIGHSRAFSVFAAAGTVGTAAHMLLPDPWVWAALRVLSGLCVAGCYTVVEGWLHAKVSNATRGRSLGIYRVVDMVGGLTAQLMIGILEPAVYASYNILAMLCCASLLPLALTRLPQPATAGTLRLHPMMAPRISPMATAGVIVAGLTSACIRMVGPVFGERIGLAPEQIGIFLAVFILGGAVAQIPVGWLADRYDRRHVMVWLSLAAMGSTMLVLTMAARGPAAIFVNSFLVGATTFPIYSVAAAHANDFAERTRTVELNSSLLFHYAIGAIVSPVIGALLIDDFGPTAMFAFIGAIHAGLGIIGVSRMLVRPSPTTRTAYVYMPRTSFLIGRLFRRHRRTDRKPSVGSSAGGEDTRIPG